MRAKIREHLALSSKLEIARKEVSENNLGTEETARYYKLDYYILIIIFYVRKYRLRNAK